MNLIRKTYNKTLALALFALILLGGMTPAMAVDFVSWDGTNVSFTPGVLVSPVATAAVAAAAAAAVLIVLAVGVRWVYKLVKGSK